LFENSLEYKYKKVEIKVMAELAEAKAPVLIVVIAV